MKKRIISVMCILMAVLVILPVSAFAVEPDIGIKRISATINGDTETSRGICWYTTVKSGSDVQLLPASGFNGSMDSAKLYSGTCSEFKDNYVHKVVTDNLTAGTKYLYRVGDASLNSWSEVCSFTTDSGENSPFSFITIADVQASSNENFARAAKVMSAAVDTMPDADFTVSLGDYVNDCTNDEWDWYFDNFEFSNSNTTSVPIAGNHDGNLKWNWFNNMFNIGAAEGSMKTTGCYYSFDYGNAHIAVLNTNDMYPMSMQQINWLKNDMNTSDADWKLVFMHRAMYSAGKNINKPDTIIMRNMLLPVIDELGIDLVMAGHDHMYFRTYQVENDAICDTTYVTEEFNGELTEFAVNPDGTVHILPGTAGTKRYNVNDAAISPILDCGAVVEDSKAYGVFTTVEVDGDKLVYKAYGYVEETGETKLIDKYAIKKDVGQNTVDPNYVPLTTGFFELLPQNLTNFAVQFTKYIFVALVKILPAVIIDEIKG